MVLDVISYSKAKKHARRHEKGGADKTPITKLPQLMDNEGLHFGTGNDYVFYYDASTNKWISHSYQHNVNVLETSGSYLQYQDHLLFLYGNNPAVRLRGTESGAKDFSLKEYGGTVRVYDEAANNLIGELYPEFYLKANKPRLLFKGTETNGILFHLREKEGNIIFQDITNGATLMKLLANKPLKFDMIIPVVLEKDTGALPADSTGEPWASEVIIPSLANYAEAVALEASWTASHSDSGTIVILRDVTANNDFITMSGNTGDDVKSAYKNITVGHKYIVTTHIYPPSSTTGATTTITKAVLYMRVNLG